MQRRKLKALPEDALPLHVLYQCVVRVMFSLDCGGGFATHDGRLYAHCADGSYIRVGVWRIATDDAWRSTEMRPGLRVTTTPDRCDAVAARCKAAAEAFYERYAKQERRVLRLLGGKTVRFREPSIADELGQPEPGARYTLAERSRTHDGSWAVDLSWGSSREDEIPIALGELRDALLKLQALSDRQRQMWSRYHRCACLLRRAVEARVRPTRDGYNHELRPFVVRLNGRRVLFNKADTLRELDQLEEHPGDSVPWPLPSIR